MEGFISMRREPVARCGRSRGGYKQLGCKDQGNPATSTVRHHQKRRWFRLRLKPRLKQLLQLASAKKLFFWIRNAYMRMMLGFMESPMIGAGYGGDASIDRFGKGPRKEYDQKVIIEVYRSTVVAQGQLEPCQTGALRIGSAVVRR